MQYIPAYQQSVALLPEWISDLNSFNGHHESIAFLIVYEANEGIFALLNTWVGQNMLQSHVYFTKNDGLNTFEKISGDGLIACVWELEIMWHEKNHGQNTFYRKSKILISTAICTMDFKL